MAREVSHSRPIQVTADRDVVTLAGPILRDEVENLVRCVRKVRGVKDVVNRLDAYDKCNRIPGLQRQGQGPDFLQS